MSCQTVIGLEVHIELKTKTKMFCSCPNDPDERHPNLLICPICLGHPGTLPTINQEAVKKVIKTGLALNCQISEHSQFDRKNYFYPDLPKGYQISQYNTPLCFEGYLEIPSSEDNSEVRKSEIQNPTAAHWKWAGSPSPARTCSGGAVAKSETNSKFQIQNPKRIRIRRIHLEEDTGRLVHPEGMDYSLIDFNRAGIPLMELVTESDLRFAKEAREFAEELHLIMHYLDVSDADMEKGQMRVEVNISLAKKEGELGTKVEIKNLNSFRAVERAIEYEIKRQTELLKKGKKIIQETRGWDDIKGITVSQRQKEESHDYRYFPEPDLPPLYFKKEDIEKIKAEIPELPQQKRERFKKEYQLDEKSIEFFIYNKGIGEYFEEVMSELQEWIHPVKSRSAKGGTGAAKPQFNRVKEIEMKESIQKEEFLKLTKLCSNYLITDLQGLLKGASVEGSPPTKIWVGGEDFLITPENFAEFIALIYEGKISSKIAKMVLEEMFRTGADPSQIIEEKGLIQITDETEIEKIIKEVISKNPKAIEDFKKGKENAFQFLIGQVMAKTKGKANPQLASNLLTKFLKSG